MTTAIAKPPEVPRVSYSRAVAKILGAMALIIFPLVAVVVAGLVLFWNGPGKPSVNGVAMRAPYSTVPVAPAPKSSLPPYRYQPAAVGASAADRSTLVFTALSPTSPTVSVYRAPAASPSQRKVIVTGDDLTDTARLSPAGDQIAFATAVSTATRFGTEISTAQVADGAIDNLVFVPSLPAAGGTAALGGFAWSAGGSRLIYNVHVQSHGGYQDNLYSIDVDEPSPQPAPVPGGQGLAAPAVSPDGTTIAAVRTTYVGQRNAVKSALVLLSLRTGAVSRPLVTDRQPQGSIQPALFAPAWSPDGRSIAVVRMTNRGPDRGVNETSRIDVVTASGPTAGSHVVAASGGSEFMLRAPVWRSGQELWFLRRYQSAGLSHRDPPSRPGDLFSVARVGTGFGTPVDRTQTTGIDERSPSFGP